MNHPSDRSSRSTNRTAGAGIGLLVVLIAVVLGMWLLFGRTGPGGSSYMGNIKETQDDAKGLGVALQARQIAMLVAQQEAATGDYPESMDEIEDFDPSTLVDEWGEPYRMKLVREGRRVSHIELRSAGSDGRFDSEDDVVHLEKLPY
jgi:hypothetical protein